VLDKKFGARRSNDGVTIAVTLELEDHFEKWAPSSSRKCDEDQRTWQATGRPPYGARPGARALRPRNVAAGANRCR